MIIILVFYVSFFTATICQFSSTRLDKEIQIWQSATLQLMEQFQAIPSDIADKKWVVAKLAHMVQLDQSARRAYQQKNDNYSPEEQKAFKQFFAQQMDVIDQCNTQDIKKLLSYYSWFTIPKFGQEVDKDAWLLVQHADHDREFQKDVLVILERLYPLGETAPVHYAYLYDRIAVSISCPEERTLQRYGTQMNLENGKWQPFETEDPEHLDERRAKMGLESMAEYLKRFAAK